MKNEIREYIPAELRQSVGAEPDRICLPKEKQIKRFPIIRHNEMRNGIKLYRWGKILKLNKQLHELYYRLRTTPKGEAEDKEETFRRIMGIRNRIESLVKEQEQKYKNDLWAKEQKCKNKLLAEKRREELKNKRAEIAALQWKRVIAGRSAYLKAHGELLDQEHP